MMPLLHAGVSDKAAVEGNGDARWKLVNLVKYHVLPPVDWTKALWTTPFMTGGAKLPTLLGGSNVVTAEQPEGEGGKVKLSSPKNSGYVYKADVYACKGYVNVINEALWPYDM